MRLLVRTPQHRPTVSDQSISFRFSRIEDWTGRGCRRCRLCWFVVDDDPRVSQLVTSSFYNQLDVYVISGLLAGRLLCFGLGYQGMIL